MIKYSYNAWGVPTGNIGEGLDLSKQHLAK